MARLTDREIAYALLRIALGVNFFGHGLVRLIIGDAIFAQGTIKGFERSPLPIFLVTPIAYAIPFIELALGLGLLIGLLSRPAYILGALFMCLLTFGSTMKSDFSAAGGQLLYSVVFAILLFCSEYNRISLDRLIRRQSPTRQEHEAPAEVPRARLL